MQQETTDSGMVELYEEMLYERAAKGIRPVLYVSSPKDLECSVLILLNKAPEEQLARCERPTPLGFGQHVRSV